MTDRLVVLMTAGSQEEADRIAGELVAARLAACVNVVPGITSVYRWQGEVQRDQEWLLIAKTRREALDRLVARVREIHSYDVPEVVALPVVDGSEAYLRWVDGEVDW
ncbi:MAG TPA: divalent-cation tolerance protein CutA [Anaerolineae bacterium]|nr:divalent-cation tolerance protein CutA [Anaerolineae bacterium]